MDTEKIGYLSFMNFRKILENTKFNVKDKYIEFMIYKMKCECNNEDSSLDDLRYGVNININIKNKFFFKLIIIKIKSLFSKFYRNSPHKPKPVKKNLTKAQHRKMSKKMKKKKAK